MLFNPDSLRAQGNGSLDVFIDEEYKDTVGTYTKMVNTSNVLPGIYYLVLSLDGNVIAKTTIKIN